jgi:hypothetical protein
MWFGFSRSLDGFAGMQSERLNQPHCPNLASFCANGTKMLPVKRKTSRSARRLARSGVNCPAFSREPRFRVPD